MATATPRKPHDIGGDPAGPVDAHEHSPTLVERRIDAMMQLLRQKPRAFWVTDENRRTIESLTPETYRDSSYYQKWCLAMRSLLVEKGVLGEAEIEAKLAEVRERHAAGPRPAAKPKRAKTTVKPSRTASARKAKGK